MSTLLRLVREREELAAERASLQVQHGDDWRDTLLLQLAAEVKELRAKVKELDHCQSA